MLDPVDLYHLQGTPVANISDRHHSEIKRIRQDLQNAIIEGLGMDLIVLCANGLVETTLQHFKSEENAMEAYKFAGLGEHRILHAKMVESVRKIWSDLERRKIGDAMALLGFFDTRLTYHMECEDSEFERQVKNSN